VGSLATFKATYLNSTVLPRPARHQLAGPISAIEQQVANGATVAVAVNNVSNKRTTRIVCAAQAQSSPFQAYIAADFVNLDAA